MKNYQPALITIAMALLLLGMPKPQGLTQTIIGGELVEYAIPVGSAEVRSARLRPYHAQWDWIQLEDTEDAKNYGEWDERGIFDEKFERTKNGDWLHTQTLSALDGEIQTHLRWLDGNTLQPLRISLTSEGGPGLYSDLTMILKTDSYQGNMTLHDGNVVKLTHNTPVPIFSAWVAGVVIKSLPLEVGYKASLPTATIHRNVNYKLWIEVTGEDSLTLSSGKVVDYWIVESGWLDLNDGDIYRQGEQDTGGLYHIAKDGDESVPLVLNYISSQTRITLKQ